MNLYQANEIARLIRQYITIDQRMKGGDGGDKAANGDANGAYDDEDIKNDDHKADEKVGIAFN